jgi:dihydrofolate synthase/folylpolyglutamate synthase
VTLTGPTSYSFTPDATLEALLHDLYQRFPPMGRSDMGAFIVLCDALGNPQTKLPPVFHVAGTNGKGSTLAFVHALCETAGLIVHKYTSPHMVRFEERIVLGGRIVDAARLVDTLRTVAEKAPEGINFFSLLTAATFVLFANTAADVVLMETGVGGTLDPTNIVTPEVSIITRISYDHMHLLGNSLAEIAANKAGIIKAGRPVVVAPQYDDSVINVIGATARQQFAPLVRAGKISTHDNNTFTYDDGRRSLTLPMPALSGAHQLINAATAMTAVGCSRFAHILDDQTAVVRAMKNVRWPGRLQRLTTGPLCALLGAHDELWLDGAHNDSGAEVLAAAFDDWRHSDSKPIHLLTAFKGKKDWQAFVAPLLSHIDSLSCLQPDLDRLTARVLTSADVLWTDITASFPPDQHPAIAAGQGGVTPHEAVAHICQQFEAAPKQSILGQRVVIAGSLYLAGHILRDHS